MSIDFFDKNLLLEDKCKKLQVSKDIVMKICDEISPILTIANKSGDNRREIWKYTECMRKIGLKNFTRWEAIMKKIKNKLCVTKDEIELLFMINYMIIVEGAYIHLIDIICFALIKSDKQLIDPRTKHPITNFDDITKLALGIKHKFLNKNNLKIITEAIDIGIRNSAAHLTYEIKDGKIYLPNSKTIDKIETYNQMREITIGIYLAIQHYYTFMINHDQL